MHIIEKAVFTNMCMIVNNNGEVLVQDRVKSWKGLAFPGGHLNEYESIIESTKREIFEETGLIVSNLKLCGIKQWFNEKEGRNVCFLFKTNSFSGNLSDSDEGHNIWMKLDELASHNGLASTFKEMLDVFLNKDCFELYLDKGTYDTHLIK